MKRLNREIDDEGRNYVVDTPSDDDAAAKALPVFTIPQIADYLVNGYWKDKSPAQQARSWPADHRTISYNLDGFSSEVQARARLAFATWDEFSKLTFVEDTGNPSADINFTTLDGGSYENDVLSGRKILGAAINIDIDNFSETRVNSVLTETFIHEIGHALGLGHAGNYNGAGGGGSHYQNDTRQFSVMSYGAQGSYGGASNADVLTPQMADIYAIIGKYGADTVRGTDTTYGFNASGLTSATEFIYDFDNFGPANEFGFNGIAPAITIYDSGGNDTLDCSGYFFDQRLDLKGGAWSDVGQFKNIIGIYRTSVIENAIGGEGLDSIYGNQVANKLYGMEDVDKLYGRTGNDQLFGGSGDDTFYMARGWDKDRVMDFETGTDTIDLTDFDFTKFSKVKALASDVAGNLLLNFGEGDTLTIVGLTKGTMLATDFAI